MRPLAGGDGRDQPGKARRRGRWCGYSGLRAAQIDHAYGLDQLSLKDASGNILPLGKGQTIAIVDAYADSSISSELQSFDAAFGLSNNDASGAFALTTHLMASRISSNSGWSLEIALDVEWAHAIAPGAHILLVEARSNSMNDLMAAVDYAKAQPGVAAVSMSWGGSEFSSETSYDSHFLQSGVAFLAASGDSSAPTEYPAISPNVIAVGGTTLSLSSGQYAGETGWSGSGGGISFYESRPSYQSSITFGGAWRMNPDVAFDADPFTGVAVYSLAYGRASWYQVGGTSIGTPQWASLTAIADQARLLAGGTVFSGSQQILTALYGMSGDFHDITSGNNGYMAGAGYDLVTGLGSPLANVLVHDLAAYTAPGAILASAGQSVSSPGTGTPARVYTKLPSADAPGIQKKFESVASTSDSIFDSPRLAAIAQVQDAPAISVSIVSAATEDLPAGDNFADPFFSGGPDAALI